MRLADLLNLIGQQKPTIVAGLGGEAGSKIISDTSTVTGEFKCIVVLEEAAFHADTAGNMEGLAGDTMAAGTILHGLFTTIKLASGKVIAYRC